MHAAGTYRGRSPLIGGGDLEGIEDKAARPRVPVAGRPHGQTQGQTRAPSGRVPMWVPVRARSMCRVPPGQCRRFAFACADAMSMYHRALVCRCSCCVRSCADPQIAIAAAAGCWASTPKLARHVARGALSDRAGVWSLTTPCIGCWSVRFPPVTLS